MTAFEFDDDTQTLKRYPKGSLVPECGLYDLVEIGIGEDVMVIHYPTRTFKEGERFPDVPSRKEAVWLRVLNPQAA